MIDDNKIMTRKKFCEYVMKIKAEKNIGIIEAVVRVCEIRNINVEDVKPLIDPTIKGLLEEEALSLNLIAGSKGNLSLFI